ncbi:MAG: hypothetical protein EAX86_07010 [Candidatus Heimdallarchaeota archaeon]|nr:hypothetical protein [Candidatus Heimdallarchaeota archaeon]
MSITPNPAYFDEFGQWLRLQGKAEGTIGCYLYAIGQIPEDVESYFANPNLKGRVNKLFAFRNYLRYEITH